MFKQKYVPYFDMLENVDFSANTNIKGLILQMLLSKTNVNK